MFPRSHISPCACLPPSYFSLTRRYIGYNTCFRRIDPQVYTVSYSEANRGQGPTISNACAVYIPIVNIFIPGLTHQYVSLEYGTIVLITIAGWLAYKYGTVQVIGDTSTGTVSYWYRTVRFRYGTEERSHLVLRINSRRHGSVPYRTVRFPSR